MPAITNMGGTETTYAIDIRNKDGALIYREASIMFPTLPEAPPEPTCFTVDCINAYQKKFDKWTEECKRIVDFYEALGEYHEERCKYCMSHRNNLIDDKYKTGEPSPSNIEEAKIEIQRLRRLNNGPRTGR